MTVREAPLTRAEPEFQAWLLAPLLPVLPFVVAGVVRGALGVGFQLALSLGFAVAVAVLFLLARQPRPSLIRAAPALLVGVAALALCAWALAAPAFEGLVSVGGGDAGNHVAWARRFALEDPSTYYRFVTFYALVEGSRLLFGLDSFEAFHLGFQAVFVCLAVVLAALAGASFQPLGRARWLAAALVTSVFTALAWRVLLPLLHYHQADGFYPHLFGLVPLLATAALFQLFERRLLRVGLLLLAFGVYRFSYGLNLADFALTAAVLVAVEAGSDRRARPWLAGVSLALALGGVFAGWKLLAIFPVYGALVKPQLHAVVRGELFLAAALGVAALLRPDRRALRFAAVFGLLNAAAQVVLLAGDWPRVYYLYKYNLHAVVLLLVVFAAEVPALVLAQLDPAQRQRGLRLGALALAAVFSGIGVFNLDRGYPEYRATFADRVARRGPWTRVIPLADRAGWQAINQVLAEKQARFGGLLAPSWPLMNFMNAGLGFDSPVGWENRGWEQHLQGRLDRRPGTCAFWMALPRDFDGYAQVQLDNGGHLLDSARALQAEGADGCRDYVAQWDPGVPERLCWKCAPLTR